MMVIALAARISRDIIAQATPPLDTPPPGTVAIAAQFGPESLMLLMAGMVVILMAAGFALMQTGLVSAKHAAAMGVKHLGLFGVSGVMVWLTGYHLIYSIEPGGFLGEFALWSGEGVGAGHSAYGHWFFQMALAAICAAIVAGTLAERLRLWPFLIFVALLTGLIYPIAVSWHWGQGWLAARGFTDFAGATLVHGVGGWAALSGAILLGPRNRRCADQQGQGHANLALASVGVLIIWFGWFGFNGGALLARGGVAGAGTIGQIFVNTNMAACGGVLTALILSQILHKKIDLTLLLSGVIGGLVSITADPVSPAIWQAAFIGAIGGVIVTVAIPILDRLRINDGVGAIPAHLLCGIWGTLVVAWSNPAASVAGQLTGIIAIGGFAFVMSFLIWMVLKYSIGMGASAQEESAGGASAGDTSARDASAEDASEDS